MRPNTEQALSRFRAVAALYVRSRIEGGLEYSTGESQRKWRGLGRRWSSWHDAHDRLLSPHERRLARKTLGKWSERARVNWSWRLEALGVLAWALGFKTKLLPWDNPYPEALVKIADAPNWYSDASSGRWQRGKLRSAELLDEAYEVAELWHWRANTVSLEGAGAARIQKIVAKTAAAAAADGLFPRPIERDFPFRGKSFRALDESQSSEAHSIASERHYALSWLTSDEGEAWDETSTDT